MPETTGSTPAPFSVVDNVKAHADASDHPLLPEDVVINTTAELEKLKTETLVGKDQFHRGVEKLRGRVSTRVQTQLDDLKAGIPLNTVEATAARTLGAASESGKGVRALVDQARDSTKPEEQKAAIGKLAMIAAPLAIGVVAGISWLATKGKAAGAGILTALGLGGTGIAAFFLGKGAAEAKTKREAADRASSAVEGKKDADGALVMKDLPPALSLFGRKLKLQGDARAFSLERGPSGLAVKAPAGNFDAYLNLGGSERGIENIGDIVPGPDGGIAVRIEKTQMGLTGSALAHLEKDQVRKLLDASAAGGAGPKSVDVTFKIPKRDFGGMATAAAIRDAVKDMTGGAVTLDAGSDPMIWNAKVVLKPGAEVRRDTLGPPRTTVKSLEETRDKIDWRTTTKKEATLETKPGTVDLLSAAPAGAPAKLLDRSKSARQSFAFTAPGGTPQAFDLRMQRGDVVPRDILAGRLFETSKVELLLDRGADTFRLLATERGLRDARGEAFGTLVDRVERTADGLALVTKHAFKFGTPESTRRLEGRTTLTPPQLEKLLKAPQKLDEINVTLNIADVSEPDKTALRKHLTEQHKLPTTPPDTFTIPLQLALQKLEGVTPPPA